MKNSRFDIFFNVLSSLLKKFEFWMFKIKNSSTEPRKIEGLSGTLHPDGSLTGISIDCFPHHQATHPAQSLEGRVTLPSVSLTRTLQGLISNIAKLEEVYAADLTKLEELEKGYEGEAIELNSVTVFKQVLKSFVGTSVTKNFSELELGLQEDFLVSTIRSHFNGLFLFIYSHPVYSSKLTPSIQRTLLRESIKCLNDPSVKAILEKTVDLSCDEVEVFFRKAYRFKNGFALMQIIEKYSDAISDECLEEAVDVLIKTSQFCVLQKLQSLPRFSSLEGLRGRVFVNPAFQSKRCIKAVCLGQIAQAPKQSLSFPKVRKPKKEIENLNKYEKQLYRYAIKLRKALGVQLRHSRLIEMASWDKKLIGELLKFLNWPEYTGPQDLTFSSLVLDTIRRVLQMKSILLAEILISIASENYLTTNDLAELCVLIIKIERPDLLSYVFLSTRFSLLDQESIETLFAWLVDNNEVDQVRELMLTVGFLSVSKDYVFLACKETLKRVFPTLIRDYLLTPQFALFSDEQFDELCGYLPAEKESGLIEFIQSFKKSPTTI
jgi:hypothetical protein